MTLMREQVFIEQLQKQTCATENVKQLCGLLLSHPIWHVAESAASIVASLARYDTDMVRDWVIAWLRERDNWRLHYGAIEVAFCIFQFDASPALFEGVVRDFAGSDNSRIRSLVAEDVAKIIEREGRLDGQSLVRGTLFSERVLQGWLQPVQQGRPDVYCPYTLEILHRLFSRMYGQMIDIERVLPKDHMAHPLLKGERPWYEISRSEFLKRIIANLDAML